MKALLFTILLALGLAPAALAASGKLSIQGHLANGGAPTDGDHAAVFTFFNAAAAGAQLWTETDTIHVAGNLFSATLGQNVVIPDTVFTSSGVWLETTIDGMTLSPRIAYYPQPQVAAAGTSSLWSTDGTNVWRSGGGVGLNTTNPPTFTLDVNGNVRLGSRSQNNVALTIDSPNEPTDPNGAQDVRFGFESAGSAGIRSYRGLSWDTYLQLLTNSYNQGSDSPQPRITIDGYGSVGIGTTTPAGRLDVASGAGAELNFSGSGDANILAPNEDLRIDAGTGWSLLFGADGIPEQLTIRHSQTTVNGTLLVNGSLTATGTKCREVTDPRFGKLYYNAVESGEAVFTTSGRGQLHHGKCHVEISPKWLAGVTIDAGHPLDVSTVTFYGPHGDWYVTPGADGFDLVEVGTSDATFYWAVQARQKGYEDRYLDHPEPVAKR